MISQGIPTDPDDLKAAYQYLGVKKIPCLMCSPLRRDVHPSFRLWSPDGKRVLYKDFATGDHGDIWDVISYMEGCSRAQAIHKMEYGEIKATVTKTNFGGKAVIRGSSEINIKVKTRNWTDKDRKYWGSFGITEDWLIMADVYPITHKIVIQEGKEYVFCADELAYAYVEFRGDKQTMKIYQPLNKKFKWMGNHNKGIISLWTKIPAVGDELCICSSVKDALCLWENYGIPSIAPQGEAYKLPDNVVGQLKERFKKVYILFDNDEPGLKDGETLAKATGFTNIVLPPFLEGKDVSDYFKAYGQKNFNKTMEKIFKQEDQRSGADRQVQV